MSAQDMFQSFLDEFLEPAISRAVNKAVKDTLMQQSKDLIDLKEAARILRVSTRTIFRYCDEGPENKRLPYTMADGKRLFERSVVETFTRKNPVIRVKQGHRRS